ncbi:MAG: Hint domain-containing protein [Chloroflexi bacterium]|nr:Hint domain-containing protein [Chloroflexota bacterium]
MKKSHVLLRWSLLLTSALALLILGCRPQQPPPIIYSLPELKYRLISNFGGVFYVDTDFYPVAREGQEEKNAQEQFPAIRANTDEFTAILAQLGLPNKAVYTNEEKLRIYREHKKLTLGVEMTPSGDIYNFVLRVGEGQGFRIEGTITQSGKITVLKREPSFNTYPICLARGTLIDTPDGAVPAEQLRPGMTVWTVDSDGKRIPAEVIKTVATPVPASFYVVRVTLSDGRSVTASPGHPTAEGRALGDYRTGDFLDAAVVVSVERLAYEGTATYDLLPSGGTGLYWANGILLKSTLASN